MPPTPSAPDIPAPAPAPPAPRTAWEAPPPNIVEKTLPPTNVANVEAKEGPSKRAAAIPFSFQSKEPQSADIPCQIPFSINSPISANKLADTPIASLSSSSKFVTRPLVTTSPLTFFLSVRTPLT